MEHIPIIILAVVLFFLFMMLIRNEIVARCRLRATNYCHDKSMAMIGTGGDWRALYEEKDGYGSYDDMLFDLSKWTYNQFYPNFEKDQDGEQ